MAPNQVDTLIVGAGVCGLWLASLLQKQSDTTLIILEKSRGVGGRMATRRFDIGSFDHGAQFYTLKKETQAFHATFGDEECLQLPMSVDGIPRYFGKGGMTTLAKALAQNLKLHLQTHVDRMVRTASGWEVHTQQGTAWTCRTLVLTCPLPQSLAILHQSQIKYDLKLNQCAYNKALVLLVEDPQCDHQLPSTPHSIMDQKAKGLTSEPGWTITLSSAFSESYFEKSDDEILSASLKEVLRFAPGLTYRKIHLKKWRYAEPKESVPELFSSPHEGLFLAGDSHGGPSINGAIRSAEALANFLRIIA